MPFRLRSVKRQHPHAALRIVLALIVLLCLLENRCRDKTVFGAVWELASFCSSDQFASRRHVKIKLTTKDCLCGDLIVETQKQHKPLTVVAVRSVQVSASSVHRLAK